MEWNGCSHPKTQSTVQTEHLSLKTKGQHLTEAGLCLFFLSSLSRFRGLLVFFGGLLIQMISLLVQLDLNINASW